MKIFVAQKVSKTSTHFYNSGPSKVFPLLCPVREKEWLQEWDYKMIYSKSGYAELGCVFSTPHHHSDKETIWTITNYDQENFKLSFVRVTPGEQLVSIFIELEKENIENTRAEIRYDYTSLNEEQNEYFRTKLDHDFRNSMQHWEKALNYYLNTGKMLGTNSE